MNWHDWMAIAQVAVTGLLLPFLNSAKKNAAEAARLAARVNGHDREFRDIKDWLDRVEGMIRECLAGKPK